MAASSTTQHISVPRAGTAATPRHTLLVRATHWLTVVAFFILLVTGLEIVVSHPRFYWGETGNSGTAPLFRIPIPASRDTVPTGYAYTMPDQNGWSRYLHFEAAWLLVIIALIYGVASLLNGHFRKNLLPTAEQRNWPAFRNVLSKFLRRPPPGSADSHTYNAVQRLAYLSVILILFPLVIFTGLALSPSFNSAFPFIVNTFGGRQSARTLHFIVTNLLVIFLVVHVAMIVLAGFWSRTRAMITGRVTYSSEGK